jgi:hypothetical protein
MSLPIWLDAVGQPPSPGPAGRGAARSRRCDSAPRIFARASGPHRRPFTYPTAAAARRSTWRSPMAPAGGNSCIWDSGTTANTVRAHGAALNGCDDPSDPGPAGHGRGAPRHARIHRRVSPFYELGATPQSETRGLIRWSTGSTMLLFAPIATSVELLSQTLPAGHRRDSRTQSGRSAVRSRGRGTVRWRTTSWCRNARFSSTRERWVRTPQRRPMRISMIMRPSSIRPADRSTLTRQTE